MTFTTLSLQNFVLLIAGLINLIMSIIVFSRGIKHNKVNLYFSLLTFFNFLMVMGIFFARLFVNSELTSFFDRSTYVSGIAIIISLLYFVIYFPNKTKELSKVLKIIIWLPALLLISIVYSKLFITHFVINDNSYDYIAYFYKPAYWIYFMYFISISLLSLYFLWNKYKITEGIFKKQIRLLFFAISIGLIFGIYFDFFLLYFEDFKSIWLGPIFTVFMNGYVFYLIFLKSKINN